MASPKLPASFLALAVFWCCSAVCDAASKPSVLYLGDSLSIGAFGKTVDDSMRSAGLNVHTFVAGGASPYYWLKAYESLPCTIGYWEKTPVAERRLGYIRAVPKLEDLISAHHPDIVVVQTGINLYATLRSRRRPEEENRAEVRSLIEQMCFAISESGATSYWILPPNSHEMRYPEALQQELASIMKSVISRYNGGIFESQQCTEFTDPIGVSDGIHYGPEDAREWAEKVATAFTNFALTKPSNSRPTHTLVRAVPVNISQPKSIKTIFNRFTTEESKDGFFEDGEAVELDLRLVAKSELKDLSELEYSNALGIFEYEVINDRLGNYPHDRVRVAHGIVFHRHHTAAANREVGSSTSLRLVPLSTYQNLETWQTVDDLRPNFEMQLFTPSLD